MAERHATLFPWRPKRVLRSSCDTGVRDATHLNSVYLMPGEGQPAAYALPPIFLRP